MEPECSSPHSKVPATCPYPEPARSCPYPQIHFLKIHYNIFLPFKRGSPKRSLSLRFPHQIPVYTSPPPIRATCPANLILLDFITRTIFGEQYRSFNSSYPWDYSRTTLRRGINAMFTVEHSKKAHRGVQEHFY